MLQPEIKKILVNAEKLREQIMEQVKNRGQELEKEYTTRIITISKEELEEEENRKERIQSNRNNKNKGKLLLKDCVDSEAEEDNRLESEMSNQSENSSPTEKIVKRKLIEMEDSPYNSEDELNETVSQKNCNNTVTQDDKEDEAMQSDEDGSGEDIPQPPKNNKMADKPSGSVKVLMMTLMLG
jgi:hypothetical protein